MSSLNSSFVFNNLSRRTPIFGLSLFTLLGISIAASILILLLLSLFLCFRLRLLPLPSPSSSSSSSSGKPLKLHIHNASPPISKQILEIPAENSAISDSVGSPEALGQPLEVSNQGWGQCYRKRELEVATGNFAEANVIGEGGYGIVYRGVLADKTAIAIKNLLNDRGQAEKEFKVEVEAIGRVGHKNLVRLLGYCVEGACRMLVYEYIDNGTLDQWLHGN